MEGMVLTAMKISQSYTPIRFFQSPDQEFYECCKERGLPPSCLDKCSYSSYSGKALRDMFLRTDTCPVRAANDLHLCATRGRDHRMCCYKNGVTSTIAGDKCLLFCQKPPENQTELDLSYLPCYDQFEVMRQCFWSDAVKVYKKNFDSMSRAMYRKTLQRYTDF
ncbi:unnamed protein product [Enterobius vermicularis]|uniref:DB domain-containing protein n=1 Tax=Enterobius vermicularis TaxID=51028 RepID=A0A0N4V1W7_ENTVE|nr:unnamed protein product [Enterobius vermicularis]